MESKKPGDGEPDNQPPKKTTFLCPVCKGRKFRSERGFSDHLRDIHNIFSCQKCDAIFASADDLARHRNETHHAKVGNKYKRNPIHNNLGNKDGPAFRTVSSPAAANTSSTQVPPTPARRSTSEANQPATETRKSSSQKRHSPAQTRQSPTQVCQGAEQGRRARGHVRNQCYQPQNQASQPPMEIPRVPVELSQAPAQIFQLPVNVPQAQVGFHQTASQVCQTPPRVHHTPPRFYQTPTRRIESQVPVYPSPAQAFKSPLQRSQQAEQVFRSPSQGSQTPKITRSRAESSHQVELPRSLEPGSQSLVQDNQQAEVPQSPQQRYESPEYSQSLVQNSQFREAPQSLVQSTQSPFQMSDQMDQISQFSMQLSAQDGTTAETNETDIATPSTPTTNTTTPSLFIQPTKSNPTFSLVYHKMKHRWTDLEPLEQTLIVKYLLGRCHTQERLHCQGYNAPKTIDTTSCLKRGEPHQSHTFTRYLTHRKAIVIDCEMIETTLCTSELAFITAIDFLTGEVLINSFVAPTAPVTNWLTPISGITPEKMDAAIADNKAFKSNADARRALRMFLDHDTVLIGHALHHDLRTLGLIHGRIVDTSVVTAEAVFSNFSARTLLPRVWGLKALANELIGIDIQTGDEGHNSLEDALATREVLIWCLRGPECLKVWAERTRSLYEQVRQQRGGQKKTVRNSAKKVRGTSSGKGRGKKKPVLD
ncbi:Exonuclease RNase T/DNA polymerase III [Penicillium expansum]|nr:Exonuclease RNase T/DNA polymerase III [Penicillium expansum]